jgi:cell division protein FtsB
MNTTWIQVPHDVDNPIVLKRFLSDLIEKLDIVFGNRGNDKYVSSSEFKTTATTIEGLRKALNKLAEEVTSLGEEIDNLIDPQTSPILLDSNASKDDIIDKVNEIITALQAAKIFV